MKALIQEAVRQYQTELNVNRENTDALFFICEELGTELTDDKFDTFCQLVGNELTKLGIS